MVGDAGRRVRGCKREREQPHTPHNTYLTTLILNNLATSGIYNTGVRTMLRCYNYLLSCTFNPLCLLLI